MVRIMCRIAPEAKYTHWKQTLFYLEEPLTVQKGEELTGLFTVAPNPRNKVRVDFKYCKNTVGSA